MAIQVKAHIRAGKKVRAYTRGTGAMGRTLQRRAKGIGVVADMVHKLGNPTGKPLKSIIKEHKQVYSDQAKYMRRGIDRNGYKGGGKMGYLISAVASKKLK